MGASLLAYLTVGAVGAGAWLGRSAGARVAHWRQHRAEERARWAAAEQVLAEVLVEVRARPARAERPALPRPLGMPADAVRSR
jgi:hypothetical protein